MSMMEWAKREVEIASKRDLRVTDMSIIDPLDTVEPHFI